MGQIELSGATTPDQSGLGSDGNEGVLRIPQISSITGNLTIRWFSVISGHLLWGRGAYPSAEMQSMYSTVPADWAMHLFKNSSYSIGIFDNVIVCKLFVSRIVT